MTAVRNIQLSVWLLQQINGSPYRKPNLYWKNKVYLLYRDFQILQWDWQINETLGIVMAFCANHCSDLTNSRSCNTITATVSAKWILNTFKTKFGKVSNIHIFHFLCICNTHFLWQLQSWLLSTALAMTWQKHNFLGDKSKFFLAKTCFRQQLKIVCCFTMR